MNTHSSRFTVPWGRGPLDFFVRGAERQLSREEITRYRIVTIGSLALLPLSTLYLISLLRMPQPGLQLPLAAACIFSHTLILTLVRLQVPSRYPGLLLCSVLTAGYIGSNIFLANPFAATHVACALIPLLSFFILGSRGGLAFAILMGLYAMVLQPLVLAKFDLADPSLSGPLAIAGNAFAAACILGVWGLSYLHSRSREAALEELGLTLKSLREGERKLSSVLESTDDVVCSLDAQGRLVTANAAMRRWYHRIFGREILLGEPLTEPSFLEHHPRWRQSFAQALQGQPVRVETVYKLPDTSVALDFSLMPLAGEDGHPVGVTLYGRDITIRRQTETRLGELHRTLLETSRKAGMAEIATGVLHNVGNTLNSLNVSATLVAEQLRGSRMPGLVRATGLLRDNAADLGGYLTRDERGRLLPEYLLCVAQQLAEEHAKMLAEIQSLTKNVDHIRSVVTMQQEHARIVGMVEQVALPELLDDALRLHATSFEQLGIQVRREYGPVPSVMVDRHKLLQILVNLLSNARHALLESPRADRQLTLRVVRHSGERLRIEVSDNGVGIAAESLPRIFSQGFTTKKSGHGFGLHASALAASEMKGSLTCSSPGRGQGATFVVDLPLELEQGRA